jgi:hypothetical protein
MNILDAILDSQNGGAVRQAGAAVGLGEDQTTAALAALVPALAAGLKQHTGSPAGLAGLIGALSTGHHQRYLDNPMILAQPGAVTDGNGILGHVLGGKDASRQVAAQVAASTGISADVIKRLLPLAATMVMGALARQRASSPAPGVTPAGGGLSGMLGSMLDRDRDGSVVDDVASMIGKFLK